VLVAAPVLPLGVTPLCVEEGRGRSRAAAEAPEPVRACGHGLDNGRLRLRVEADGTVAISERGSGRSAHGLGGIVDERDLGDSYTPSPRGVLAREPDTVAVRVVHAGPLRGELEVVRRWDRVALTLTTRVRLDADAQHVVLDSEGVNGQDDHRLRAVFPLGERMTRVVADGHFGPVERAPARGRTRRAAGELEAAPPTAPMQRWVAVAGRTRGLAVLTDGLPQCEARAGGELLVTLLRACGELSRADLPERPGHAGWPTPTPEGQCRGPFRARLAVVLCDPAALDDATPIESAAEAFLAPPWALMRRWLLRVPPPVAGPALHGHGLVVSAVKPAESGDGVVLRCYNATAGAVEGVWHVPWPLRDAVRCRLDESALEPLSAERGVVRFTAAPRAVVTIRVRSG
jgi:alpha-mannosidase